MNANRLRLRLKRAKPAFKRTNWILKRVGPAWRKPKGAQSKLRQHHLSRGRMPGPGYGSPRSVRGLHPSGLKEARISNPAQLTGLEPGKFAVRIESAVGNLKRNAIQNSAKAAGLTVLNPRTITIRKKTKPEVKPEA